MESPSALFVESTGPGSAANTIRVCFTGFSPIEISSVYLPPEYTGAFLCPGAVFGPEAEAAFRHAAECLSAEKAALRLIARAEQYGAGLARKLEQRGHDPIAVHAVLVRLLELGLVNDRRYAELWLKSRVGRGKRGPRTLETALRAKGIDRETAGSALRTVLAGGAEAGLLERCVKKAAERRTPEEFDSEIRFFLKSEGFSSAAIEMYLEKENL